MDALDDAVIAGFTAESFSASGEQRTRLAKLS